MILQALYQLAERENLVEDPDYEPRPIAWLVHVDEQGGLSGIVGTHTVPPAEGRRRPRPVPRTYLVPREAARTSGDYAFFLFDKAEYVFGLDPSLQRPAAKLTTRAALFRTKVRTCLEATGDQAVRAIDRLLAALAEGRQQVALPEGCAANDLFAFVYAPDVDQLVTARPTVREHWRKLREAPAGAGARYTCLVTAQAVAEPGLFPPIKRVPGGAPSGVGLVSYNASAFESHGLKSNENAPICRAAAEAAATALNRLLHPAYPRPGRPTETLPRRSLMLSADTVVCYWSSSQTADDFASFLGPLLEANPEEVHGAYRSIWHGRPAQITDPSAFYALTLSGAQGRAIVRDWLESSVREVQQHLAQHFADIAHVRCSRLAAGRQHPPSFPLGTLLEALADPATNRREAIPAPLSAEIVRAALAGTLYPLSALQRALLRYRAEIGDEHSEGLDGFRARQWNDARAALIKAVLNRRRRRLASAAYPEVRFDMDPTCHTPGYTLGRLMAVLERLQQEALGNVNASVVDRYFSGASATPKSVFVPLVRNARHHVRKLRDAAEKRGLAFQLERLLDELLTAFEPVAPLHPHRAGFPAHLALEEQGLFVLGYHQMRHWLWMTREERSVWEQAHPDAARAYRWSRTEESQVPSPNADSL
ncbi:MAG: type I-C CRISPR-associated protein Cas8c/Csd1 [Candidatus Latescibacterota bacterium]